MVVNFKTYWSDQIKQKRFILSVATKYIYVIYRLGGPDRKIFCRGLKNSPRPRDVFETSTKYFSIRTDLNGKKRIYFFVEHSEANGNGFIRLRI